MKTIKIIIFNLTILICLLSCRTEDSNHHTISFVNKSESPVYITYEGTYPDTLPITLGVSIAKDYKVDINEKNITALGSGISAWEKIFKRFTSDTLMVYVFDASKVDSLIKEKPSRPSSFAALVKRYDLSLNDLQRMGWVLYYPPTEAMKDIKMWPPYGN
ncbi:hypothetical protein FACS189434_04160 [Bacteroidia bacterium]|nr:hypothetical protein FACS189434_04160 [Bacteroidia bacterium]